MVSPVGSVKRFKMHCILMSPLATRAPTSFCTSGYRRALLARMASSGVGTHRSLLAILQGNPGRATPDFVSVHTLAVLAILRFP